MHARSLSGPWPGTTVVAPRASIRSQASIQWATGPAHTIGWPPWNTRSPVNSTSASGTCTTTSPPVCAGPSSSSRTGRSPTRSSSSPSKVVVGGTASMPSKVNGPKMSRRKAPASPSPSAARISPASIAGGTSSISRALAGRGDDVGAGDELVAVAVVAVGVGVHHGADGRGRRRHGAELVEHLLGERQVEQRVDEQRRVAVGDQPGVRPAPPAVGLEVGPEPVAHLVGAPRVAPSAEVEGEVEAADRAGEDVRLDVGRGDDPQVASTAG